MTKFGISTGRPPHSQSGAQTQAHAEPPALTPAISVLKPGPWVQFLQADGFEWTVAELPIPGLPADLEGFRLLHLSDLHIRTSWDRAYDELIERVEQNPPDLILYTGDFVEHKHDHRGALPVIGKLVSGLKSRLGFVTILGNHDGDLMGPPLTKLGITLLNQQRLCLGAGSATLEIIGLVGVDRFDLNQQWLRSIGPKQPRTVRIMMSHFPDLIRPCAFLRPDIFLAGHTHGGQVCLPGRIPIIRHDSLDRRFWLGIHRIQDMWLVVNRGLGFSTSLKLRLFCPAEVIEIRLRRA